MRRVLLFAVALAPALVGCDSGTPNPNNNPDMATSANDLADPSVDLATPPDLSNPIPPITGKVVDRYYVPTTNDNGTMVDAPRNLTNVTIAAYVRDPQGVVTTFPGSGKADGTFAIPNVPEGTTYIARVGTRYLLDTTSRSLTLGDDRFGRPDAVLATKQVRININVGNLAPLADADELSIYSPTVDASRGAFLFNAQDPPLPLDTKVNTLYDYFALEPKPWLYNNDAVYFAQLAGLINGNLRTFSLLRSLGPVLTTVTDAAVGGSLTGNMSTVMQNQSVTLDWRRSAFSALVSAVHPKAALSALDIHISPSPGGFVRRGPPYNPPLLDLHTGTDIAGVVDTGDLKTAALSYGNPYPSAWGQQGVAEAVIGVAGQAFSGSSINARVGYVTDLTTFRATPVTPPLGPPTALKLVVPAGEKDLRTSVMDAGLAPTLKWSAPALGTPDRYLVRIVRRNNADPRNLDQEVAVIETTGTQLVIPPEVLQTKVQTYLTIRALRGSGALAPGLPQAWADAVSTIITP